MLSVCLLNTKGEKIALPTPLSFVINREAGAADDITLHFSARNFPKCNSSKIELSVDGVLEFTGIIDELRHTLDNSGAEIMIYARSTAAALLDNEAKAADYKNANASLINRELIAPLGIGCICEDNGEYTDISIYKGISRWQVIKNFCSLCYSNEPYVDKNGNVVLFSAKEPKELYFSNTDGIKYTRSQVGRKYYRLISSVYSKPQLQDDYSVEIKNPLAEKYGIIRTRYADSTQDIAYCDRIISQSNEKSLEVKIEIPEFLHCSLYDKAAIKLENGAIHSGLKCTKIRHTLTKNGFGTVITATGEIEGS